MARLLPDAFKVMAIQGSGLELRGRASRSRPAWRSDCSRTTGPNSRTSTGLKVHPETAWMVDYAEAERIGMAVTLALKRPGTRVDQLFVFGVRRSLDPRQAAPAALGDLLESHRCTRGLAFVPQGTPTNNTESDRSVWQRRVEPRQPERDPTTPDARANAAVLAAAFGLAPEALDNLDYGATLEQARARRGQRRPVESFLGYVLRKDRAIADSNSTVPFAMREQARAMPPRLRARPRPAARHPRGQPTVRRSAGVERRCILAPRGDDFETKLVALLPPVAYEVASGASTLSHGVGKGPIDQAMSEMLGSTAVSIALRVRPVMSYEMVDIATQLTGAGVEGISERQLEALILRDWGIDADRMYGIGSLGTKTRPLALHSYTTAIPRSSTDSPTAFRRSRACSRR